ncbi:MAG: glycosyltransferase family 4 protein [Syntrophorhabdales bacterium]|jgi:glycosyltransferase involved in cell wall biosynthesis
MKKNILVLAHNIRAEANPNGYRIQQYFPYFQERGFEVTYLTDGSGVGPLIRALRAADVVYVQRLLPGPMTQYLLRIFAGRMVFDFDDAIMYGARRESSTRRRRFRGMVRLSNAVFCGNHFLLREAQRYGTSNLFYVPTVVDTSDYPVKNHTAGGPFVVGWMGSASTLRYLTDMEPFFASAPAGITYRIVADRRPDIAGAQITFEKWRGEKEKSLLLSFDVGTMPVRDDIWSRGKCGLKLIQYAAAGLPSITHPVGVSREIVEEGETGFLRQDIEGWREAVDRLRGDLDLRRSMGVKARALAEERYSLAKWGPRVASMIDSL